MKIKLFFLLSLPSLLTAYSPLYSEFFDFGTVCGQDRALITIRDFRAARVATGFTSASFKHCENIDDVRAALSTHVGYEIVNDYSFISKYGLLFRTGWRLAMFNSPEYYTTYTFNLNIQGGYYVHLYGGIRAGLFYGRPGLGFDYWFMYSAVRWLMSLEFAHMTQGQILKDFDIPKITFINKLFFTDTFYLNVGFEHYKNSTFETTQNAAFIGIGVAF